MSISWKILRSGALLRISLLGAPILPTLLLLVGWGIPVQAAIPTVLTDKIHKGSGVIDIMQDVSGSELNQYLDENGQLILGVDLNENASGNESASSVGIAIKQVELLVTTTEGVFTFDEFYTGTTAVIQEAGAVEAEEFYVLFGTAGSSQITGGTSGFDLSAFDDVIRMKNVAVTGDILDAQLSVVFLETAVTGVQGNETFFDFSNGFEDFAILTEGDAQLLEEADLGMADASETVVFKETVSAPPAAPWPPWPVLACCALIFIRRLYRD